MSQATLGSAPYHNSSLFSGYYLDERIADLDEWDCDSDATAAFEELQHLWELEGDLLPSQNEDELLGTWIDEVLDILGFDTLQETTLPDGGGYNDRLLFESGETRREASARKAEGEVEAMYGLASAVLEAKQWDADFSARFNEQRSYRDASHQIKYYLEHTPERLQWGILTDGKKWRLYGTKDYATEIYYEVDLPELLESGDLEQFKYFYAFFRPEAFREVGGTTFLDTVWNESETAAQELGEDLQDNVFTALRVLGEGFVHTNDLDIDPDDEVARAELKEQSLVLLYRLMFVLYAESRGLIHPDDPDAQAEYDENFSLDQIRLDIHEAVTSGDAYDDWSGYATQIWGQLQDLFGLVDSGEADLGIPPYNGGLFDDESHAFLAENEVADRYIAEVIHRLGTTAGEDGAPVLADYADLDTRHLGSIYEGLLEHEFRIADEPYAAVAEDGGQVWKPGTEVSVAEAVETVEEGELYVVNDDGERKATGAYYTPDYVVSYIVEETVDPLLDDIRTDLEDDGLAPSDTEYFRRFWQQVLDLKVLDPAMGSAHFLTSATGYLTEQVMEVVREQEIQSYDEQELRRTIAKECIYGVDINGMAVELGKLSMWLETLAADKPLAFLDHHLKAGNSLVGSDISEVLSDDTPTEGGQLTLGQAFAHARQQTLEHVMDLMEDLLAIDNDDLADIKSMEEIYDEIRADPLYQRLFEIANVHTAEEFGLDVPEGVYEKMAGAIEDEAEWAEIRDADWFTSAQAMADEEAFFHWELEFPEVFFGSGGERLGGAGFDAVIGNPPWMDFQRVDPNHRKYQRELFESAQGKYDLYVAFVERANGLLAGHRAQFGFIIQNKFLASDYGKGLKNWLINNVCVTSILDFEDAPIFKGTTTYPLILTTSTSTEATFKYAHLEDATEEDVVQFLSDKSGTAQINIDELEAGRTWIFPTAEQKSTLESINNTQSRQFGNLTSDIPTGIKTNFKDAYVFEKPKSEVPVEDELLRPVLDGADIKRYAPAKNEKYILYPYEQRGDELAAIDLSEYPRAEEHLRKHENELRERLFYEKTVTEMGKEWFEFPYTSESLLSPKLLFPDISTEPRATFDASGDTLILNTAYGATLAENVDVSEEFVCALFNSSVLRFAFTTISPKLSGGYYRFQTQYVGQLPIVDMNLKNGSHNIEVEQLRLEEEVSPEKIVEITKGLGDKNSQTHHILELLAHRMVDLYQAKMELNLSLLDHLGSYSDGPPLSDVGLTQPPKGSADSILQETTEQKPNLRIGEATVARESDSTVEIRLTARYKPDDDDAHETDQWGYTETDPLPALRITDLSETEADLIEAFVPVAVDEAGGFADFRETATKTNSLVDRLRKLTLPAVDDVADGLESYVETRERADELEAKIERTDDLIDEIVYELYGLTDEEIAIVEEAVGE